MTFFLAAGLMLLLAAAVVAWPLWRPRVPQRAGVVGANREVHAARLKELQEDLQNGRLSPDDHAAARHDLEKDLAGVPSQDPAPRETRPRKVVAIIVMVLMLSAGATLYGFYGNWRIGAQGVEAASTQAIVDMVAVLDKRLHTPGGQDDLKGWDMLGRSYVLMARYADALDAFGHARKLSHDGDPQVLSEYAEALALSHPELFMDQALPLFERVLQIDPANVQALWYGGLGALQRGDKLLAISRWNAILSQNPPQDYRNYIEKAIADAGGAPAASVDQVFVSVHVSLDPTMVATLSPDTTVYVYAQPKDAAAGPPLAVRRLQVKDLPLDLKLSDQDAVMPGRVISAYDDLLVTARVSKSGAAEPHAGDLVGRGEWLKAADKQIPIVIDTVLR